jgi:hypothetical protein
MTKYDLIERTEEQCDNTNYSEKQIVHIIITLVNKHYFACMTMLSGSTATTAWRVLGLRTEETASRYGG